MVLLVKFFYELLLPHYIPVSEEQILPKVFLLLLDGMGFQSIAADLIHQFLKFLQSFQSTNLFFWPWLLYSGTMLFTK